MATPFSNIYDKFLLSIDDVNINKLSDELMDDLLYKYLDKSVSLEFKKCKKNLKDIDLTNKQFNETLTNEEEWIVSQGMVLTYIGNNTQKQKLLKQSLGDRDYKISSNHLTLNSLIELETKTRKILKKYLIDYSYNDFEGFN